jgi:hypothetical protein
MLPMRIEFDVEVLADDVHALVTHGRLSLGRDLRETK